LSSHIEENIINSYERMFSWRDYTRYLILVISSNWLESILKRNQFMNIELFIKSLINDIDSRIIKDENSWSYAWRFYHKRLWMIHGFSITIQDMIWKNRNQTKQFSLWKWFLMSLIEHYRHTTILVETIILQLNNLNILVHLPNLSSSFKI